MVAVLAHCQMEALVVLVLCTQRKVVVEVVTRTVLHPQAAELEVRVVAEEAVVVVG